MRRWFLIFMLCLVAPVWADDCLSYKITPAVYLDAPQWTKEVVQPLQEMDLLHGNVIATMTDNYDIVADITSIEDGFCVAMKSVNAVVGYSNFLVQIDIRHVPNTCTYDAVLSHEDEHIRTYLSVIDDNRAGLINAIYSAANSVTPVFVRNSVDVENAINVLNERLQSHPDLILAKQKIKSDEEIRNKKIDINNTGTALKKCFE